MRPTYIQEKIKIYNNTNRSFYEGAFLVCINTSLPNFKYNKNEFNLEENDDADAEKS